MLNQLIGTMTVTSMEKGAPRGAFVVFRYKGMLVDVVTVTRDPAEANALYREGLRGYGRKVRATTHIFARPE